MADGEECKGYSTSSPDLFSTRTFSWFVGPDIIWILPPIRQVSVEKLENMSKFNQIFFLMSTRNVSFVKWPDVQRL